MTKTPTKEDAPSGRRGPSSSPDTQRVVTERPVWLIIGDDFMPRRLPPLLIESGPSADPHADLVRKHAEGLAREIHADVHASVDEIANAIEFGIRRFARREWQRVTRRNVTETPKGTQAMKGGRSKCL
jgi:hypothetical protein